MVLFCEFIDSVSIDVFSVSDISEFDFKGFNSFKYSNPSLKLSLSLLLKFVEIFSLKEFRDLVK